MTLNLVSVFPGELHLDLRHVRRRAVARQGDAVAIDQGVLLDPRPGPVRGVIATPLDAAEGAGEGAIDGRTRPVDLAGVVEALEQDLVDM